MIASLLGRGRATPTAAAERLVTEALKTAKAIGAGGKDGKGLAVFRADSAFYGHDVIAAALIAALTHPGDLVLDPFCGSGTVPAAAVRAGRRVLAGDRDPLCVRMTRERLAAITTPDPGETVVTAACDSDGS